MWSLTVDTTCPTRALCYKEQVFSWQAETTTPSTSFLCAIIPFAHNYIPLNLESPHLRYCDPEHFRNTVCSQAPKTFASWKSQWTVVGTQHAVLQFDIGGIVEKADWHGHSFRISKCHTVANGKITSPILVVSGLFQWWLFGVTSLFHLWSNYMTGAKWLIDWMSHLKCKWYKSGLELILSVLLCVILLWSLVQYNSQAEVCKLPPF